MQKLIFFRTTHIKFHSVPFSNNTLIIRNTRNHTWASPKNWIYLWVNPIWIIDSIFCYNFSAITQTKGKRTTSYTHQVIISPKYYIYMCFSGKRGTSQRNRSIYWIECMLVCLLFYSTWYKISIECHMWVCLLKKIQFLCKRLSERFRLLHLRTEENYNEWLKLACTWHRCCIKEKQSLTKKWF